MDEKELWQYVDLGLVSKDDYTLFSKIMNDAHPKTQKERILALILFYYTNGDYTAEEYEIARHNVMTSDRLQ